ncbi:hypothetical protein [Pseudooceanicola nanhaiensis]|uniref:hypothetical protein n=1 Tax=Pseudooceanicola nanhaiensis TaxID=375761 RepID=UPI001CD374C6|nr:hypothetical protein [Pseudooceanicola nanhaiensis]MCA0919822.1 hypothetical protein [Pseudooceanicola nanhaiensis]
MAPYGADMSATDVIITEDDKRLVSEGSREELRTFISENPDHPLIGAAQERLALCFPPSGQTFCPTPRSENP